MGKQRTQERLRAGEDTLRWAGGIPQLFEDHYRLAVKSMTEEYAAATAHDAVQRHLASMRESSAGGDGM